MKEGKNITILVLGDGGVGKSSLTSTFVSRHFSEHVPGVLTRVRLPPDASLSKCTTTIIDTQEGDAVLKNALSLGAPDRDSSASTLGAGSCSGSDQQQQQQQENTDVVSEQHDSRRENRHVPPGPYRSVDAIVLVYDIERIETFHRVKQHWLPLIEQCYRGDLPVIVAGNKVDVSSASDGENAPTRQQIISLLQQYKFVRQCMKCSAKQLLNVDEVFRKAQHSVVYPVKPLYDFEAGNLSAACSKAFTRIFRMFDTDRDGLLSDAELNVFQQRIWGVSLIEKDFAGWKKMVTRMHDSPGEDEVLRDGKFTLAGFLAIWDVLMTNQNRLEVPWKVLRTLGYDDELNLSMPAHLCPPQNEGNMDFAYLHPDDWRLNSSEVEFLGSFVKVDSNGQGAISSTDMQSILSVLPSPDPLWSQRRGDVPFRDCWSRPLIEDDDETPPASPGRTASDADISSPSSPPSSPSSIISASGVTISSSPLPSIDISKDTESVSCQELAEHKPLSFLQWINRWHMCCTISPLITRAEMYRLGYVVDPKQQAPRVLQNLRRVGPALSIGLPQMPSIFVRAVVLGSKDSGSRGLVHKLHRMPACENDRESGHPATSCSVSTTKRKGKEITVHLILTEFPALSIADIAKKSNLKLQLGCLLGMNKGARPYDIAVLAFDAANPQSFEDAKGLESALLTDEMPRVFIGTSSEAAGTGVSEAMRQASKHCACMELEPPFIVSLAEDGKSVPSAIEHVISCVHDDDSRSIPHSERKQRAAKRRKALWIGGLVTAGITVVLGLTVTGKRKGRLLGFFKKFLPF